ncbi:MAG TPA: hypothetical protein VH083_01915 [Myxococcales bacterium]|jgi:hypothetical protein|nr:hypothetical protein [Myxococcales bacterium]
MSQGIECVLKVAVGTLAALVLVGLARGRPAFLAAHRRRVLQALAVLGGLAFLNFGGLHTDGTPLHLWDQYHYFVGSKFFPELGYDGLYVATIQARREQLPELPPPARLRDLRTNALVSLAAAADHTREVRARFSDARWREFSADAARFYLRDDIFLDNGLKATPSHIQILRLFSRWLPFRTRSMYLLALLDFVLLALSAYVIHRAFGLEALAGVALTFGIGFCSRYYWVGGAFLRQDWLAALILAAASLRSGRNKLAGAAVAYASVVRIFPAIFAGPLLLHWLMRGNHREAARFLGMFAAVAAALFLAGWIPQPAAWPQSIAGLITHSRTVFPNSVGLRVPFITSFANLRGGLVNPDTLYDYVAISRDYAATLLSRLWLVVPATIAFVWLALRAAIRAEDAAAAFVLGIALIFALTAPTCYYGTYFALMPLVRPVRTAAVFLGASVLTYAVAIAVLAMSSAGWMQLNGAAVFGPASLLLGLALIDWMLHFPVRAKA